MPAFLALIPKPLLYGAVGLVVGAAALAGVYAYGKHEGRMAVLTQLRDDRIQILKDGKEIDDEALRADDDALCALLGGCELPEHGADQPMRRSGTD